MRLVVGMTGATGAAIGIRLLEVLSALDVETHLVLSRWAKATIEMETCDTVHEVQALASSLRWAAADCCTAHSPRPTPPTSGRA